MVESMPRMKACSTCKRNLPASNYYPEPRNRDGLFSRCKDCGKASARESYRRHAKDRWAKAKAWREENYERHIAQRREYRAKNRDELNRKKRERRIKAYGLSLEEYQRRLSSQGNRCAICTRKPADGRRKLVIDHCHKTGKVRGLICNECNWAIGLISDNPVIAIRISKYLHKHA
jgi:hypothetical protein